MMSLFKYFQLSYIDDSGNPIPKYKIVYFYVTRISIPLLLVTLLFSIGYILYITSYMKSTVPITNGTISVTGLKQPVEVNKDKFGVPYIHAQNKQDAYFALGYIYASERLFQMQFSKRVFEGRLSENLGSSTLKLDKFFRTLGMKRSAQIWLDKNSNRISPEAMEDWESYLKGVNTFIKEGKKPEELTILGIDNEEITKADTLAFIGLMSYGFTESIFTDPILSSLEKDLGKEKVQELTLENVSTSTYIKDSAEKSVLNTVQDLKDIHDKLHELGFSLLQGSNSWVVSSKRSKSNQPILSNDPHIAFSNPAVWFEAHIKYPNYELYGFYLPLIPQAVIGFNQNYAWGLTMFGNDDMDFYSETIDKSNPNHYLFKGQSIPFKKRQETIKVKWGTDITLNVLETHHGPILTGVHDSMMDPNTAISVRWAMYDDINNPVQTFWQINHAQNINEFESGLEHLKSPGINFVYADNKDNIGYWAAGVIYDRNFNSHRILNGESGEMENDKIILFSQNPKSINPASGMIITANNRHAEKLPYNLAGYWQADDRSNRLNKILRSQEKWTQDEFKKVIMDDYFESTDYMLEIMFNSLIKNFDKLDPYHRGALKELRSWDRRGDKNTSGALIFSEFRIQLAKAIFEDEMGKQRLDLLMTKNRIHHYTKWAFLNPNHSWWDNVHTPEKETRDDIILEAFEKTVHNLVGNRYTSPDQWKWGQYHTLEHIHPLGYIKPLNHFFNSKKYPIDGGNETVNNLASQLIPLNYKVRSGPSMRLILDFSNMDKIFVINPLGNSGHRMSPHFQDQMQMYIRGEFREISLKSLPKENRLILKP